MKCWKHARALIQGGKEHEASPQHLGALQAEVPPSREWSTSTGDSVDGEYMHLLQFRTNLASMDTASLLALSRISAKLGSNIETMVQSELDSRPVTQEAAPSVEVKSEESSSVSRPPACQRFFIDIF